MKGVSALKCGLLLATLLVVGPSLAWAVSVEITTPAGERGRFVKGHTGNVFECRVDDAGDKEYYVVWMFYDLTGDVQEGVNLTQVYHDTPNAGAWYVDVAVYDLSAKPPAPAVTGAIKSFWVLWVEVSVQPLGATAEPAAQPWVSSDNNCGVRWLELRRADPEEDPKTPRLGQTKKAGGLWVTGFEVSGQCTPPEWDQPVQLQRIVGSGGAKHWKSPQGADLASSKPPALAWDPQDPGWDTSDPYWRDDDPQSSFTWDKGPLTGQTFESYGVVYDIDWPGFGALTPDTIARSRCNFVERAFWVARNRQVSDTRDVSVAHSQHFDGETYTVDNEFDARGDNQVAASLLPSTEWDLED